MMFQIKRFSLLKNMHNKWYNASIAIVFDLFRSYSFGIETTYILNLFECKQWMEHLVFIAVL